MDRKTTTIDERDHFTALLKMVICAHWAHCPHPPESAAAIWSLRARINETAQEARAVVTWSGPRACEIQLPGAVRPIPLTIEVQNDV